MKTAVSIPVKLFAKSEKLAKELKISRSELYQRALDEFILSYNFDEVTKKLNKLFGNNKSNLDPELAKIQYESLKDIW